MDTVFTYDPALHEVARLKMPAGCGCRHLAFSDDGAFAYCADELSSTISALSYADGGLYPILAAFRLPMEEALMEGCRLLSRYRNGKVYIASRTDSRIFVFDVTGGRMTYRFSMPSGGISPRDFDVFDDFIICANEMGGAYVTRAGGNARPISISEKIKKAFV